MCTPAGLAELRRRANVVASLPGFHPWESSLASHCSCTTYSRAQGEQARDVTLENFFICGYW